MQVPDAFRPLFQTTAPLATVSFFKDPTPFTSDQIGTVAPIITGGGLIVVPDSKDDLNGADAGALHVYDRTGRLITSHYGQVAGDQLSSKAPTSLTNNNFLIHSPLMDVGAIDQAGVVILASGSDGSEVARISGDQTNDRLGNEIILTGAPTIFEVGNGLNFVIISQTDDNGGLADAGSVIVANAATGEIVSITRGDQANDFLGTRGAARYTNGNFGILNRHDNDAGALFGSVMFFSGTSGALLNQINGAANLDIDNSTINNFFHPSDISFGYENSDGNPIVYLGNLNSGLVDNGACILINKTTGAEIGRTVGLTAFAQVGQSTLPMGALNSANFLCPAQGANGFRGAHIYSSGATGTEINRISGATVLDITSRGLPLSNGNFVVFGNRFDGGAGVDTGVAILVNGTTGIEIGRTEGVSANDKFATAAYNLGNGNYLATSNLHDNGAIVDAGAVVLFNGTTGIELARFQGSTANDQFGDSILSSGRVTVLDNGNFVICAPNFDSGAIVDAGVAIIVNGQTGAELGRLTGTTASDQICSGLATKLNDNLVAIESPLHDVNGVVDAGSFTIMSGVTGAQIGQVAGDTASDSFGNKDALAVTDSKHIILLAPNKDDGATADVGAIIVFDTNLGIEIRRILGDQANDQLGTGSSAVASGQALILSQNDDVDGIVDAGSIIFIDDL